ncbi:CAZyme family AA11 [Penicillium malachiteum]|nr:CAZyme family AA11 [Penicillium malachiteum]
MSPEPYSSKILNNSPLANNGSDFPCKLGENAFVAPTKETVYEVGVSSTMRFKGSTTHGGGSCQLSLTGDLAPSKQSIWKVIKSFEGGCPVNVEGGLSGGGDADNDIQLDFAIPEKIHSGKYTLAWTWFNRIGDREMYMNCAPITVDNPSSPVFNQSIQNQAHHFHPCSSRI